MLKITLATLVLIAGISAHALPATSLRIPVLVTDTQTDKVLAASSVKSLHLPSVVVVDQKTNVTKLTEQLQAKIQNERYELVLYTSIGEFTNTRVVPANDVLCFLGNAHEAVGLLNGMADAFLSDQLQLNFYRVAGEAFFRNPNEKNRPVTPGTEEYEWTKKNLKIPLKPGQILTVTAYSDGGDDENLDIISQCR